MTELEQLKRTPIDTSYPDFLKKSIEAYLCGREKHESGRGYFEFDMDYCDLQTDINVCEVEQLISPSEAWMLRKKYLGITAGDNK